MAAFAYHACGEQSHVPSNGYNPGHKRDIHQSHSDSLQGKIQKPPDVISLLVTNLTFDKLQIFNLSVKCQ